MRSLWSRVAVGVALALAAYAAFSFVADVRTLGDRLARVAPGGVFAALALSLGNYFLRFVRWDGYLRRVDAVVPRRLSAHVFLCGLGLSITPGKVGELVKSALLREAVGIPATRTMPVVIAERVTDLIALVLLALVGVALYGVATELAVAGAILVALGLVALMARPVAHRLLALLARVPGVRRFAPRLAALYDGVAALMRPAPLLWATSLAIPAWLCECVGFALVVRAFPGAEVSFGLATAIYAATTIAGALSFLPGGLIVTEASMTLLLVTSAAALDQPTAIAAVLVTRACTLWFAVALGLVALAVPRCKLPDR